ncbi:MAG: tRNA (N6-isopentenyl adenosine(37)-C2)-methylthiotransferase MiaB [Candidatus Kapabacteria bacterium]|nr:tRNA (N6-isopentenyl adenosine(37)-C2)-methylthiotransferase MiaB [Candidatus Kapabacteria bacterium]
MIINELNKNKKVYIETYGCQMNLSDSEIVSAVLTDAGCNMVQNPESADVILLNTCSVRENAELTINKRLLNLNSINKKGEKIIGILGCMAERLRERIFEQNHSVSLIVGPDEYRRLPEILGLAFDGEKGIAVKLSRQETYDDISPLRVDGKSAWISVMRGCNNFCSYCIVPFARGRERSRSSETIYNEIIRLENSNYKEITLLGQNVNSYLCPVTGIDFPDLLAVCAVTATNIRFRFVTSHPKDMSDKLINTIAKYSNVCKHIHLPVQSGSDAVLSRMNRIYSSAQYLELIRKIRNQMPEIAISTDIIAGFPGETEEDHLLTIKLMNEVNFDGAFMFKYSPRENTTAFKFDDDVSDEIKLRRLNEIIHLQNSLSAAKNRSEHGIVHNVLVECPSKRNHLEWQGRSDTNKTVIFPNFSGFYKTGDLVQIKIERSSSATMFGTPVNTITDSKNSN